MFNATLMRGERVCISVLWQMHPLTSNSDAKIDPLLETQFAAGRLYAVISSRPGQSGRADGYILEGKELEVSKYSFFAGTCTYYNVYQFYLKKLRTGKQKHA
jgi:small subunit ribosomal protein S8e